MTSPKGTEIRQQYFGTGGDPTEVVGISSSGGAVYEAAGGGFTVGLSGLQYGMTVTGSAGAYGLATYATKTPGTISEKTKSAEQLAYENRKARLIDAVNVMKRSAPNWSGSSTRISDLSAQSAERFLRCLPGDAVLPRVAPDGEGDVMFVWDGQNQQSCVVTVEQHALHLACQLGTPQEQHIAEQRFLGVRIPTAILERIPSK
jgi:hypothetical protein